MPIQRRDAIRQQAGALPRKVTEMADALKMTPQVPVWLADLLADLNGSSATGGFRCFDANIELKFGVSNVKGLSKVTSFLRGMARPLNAEFRAHQVWEGNSEVIVLGDAVLSVKKRPDVVVIPPFAYFFQMSKRDRYKVQRLTIVAGPVADLKGVAE